jgi:hypothetical protein
MIIDDEGLVGIGTATPSVPFEVIGEGDFRTVYISDNTSAASTVSAQGTTVIDDGDWAADASNTQWYLAKLSDNTTARSGSNQVVITDAGSLGLGTTSPTDKLHLDGNMRVTGTFKDASGDVGTSGQVLSSTATGTDWITPAAADALTDSDDDTKIELEESADEDKIRFDTAGTERMIIDDEGIVGIGVVGTLNPNARLEVNGDVHASAMLLTSDARYKINIKELTNALDIVLKLRGVRHEWKQGFRGKKFSKGTVLGLIAQEVEPYLPEVVQTDANGFKSVDYTKLTPLLIEAIQSQQKQLNAQQERLKRIEKKLGINP